MDTTTHTTFSAILPHTPEGGIAGFRSTCETCGLVIANTVRTNVELELREHTEYWTAKLAR